MQWFSKWKQNHSEPRRWIWRTESSSSHLFAAVCGEARFSQDYSCVTFVFLFTLTANPEWKRRNLTRRQSSSKPRRRKRVFCQKQKSVRSAQNRFSSPREKSRRINREQRKDKPERKTTRKQSGNKQQARRVALSRPQPRRGRSSLRASQPKRAKRRLTVIQSRRKRNPNRRKPKEDKSNMDTAVSMLKGSFVNVVSMQFFMYEK